MSNQRMSPEAMDKAVLESIKHRGRSLDYYDFYARFPFGSNQGDVHDVFEKDLKESLDRLGYEVAYVQERFPANYIIREKKSAASGCGEAA